MEAAFRGPYTDILRGDICMDIPQDSKHEADTKTRLLKTQTMGDSSVMTRYEQWLVSH